MKGPDDMRLTHLLPRAVVAAALFAVAGAVATAEATPITVTDTKDWNAQTGVGNAAGITYETFSEPDNLPSWSQTLTFGPPDAASFVSASVTVNHRGNRASDNEMWLLYDGGSTLLGTLTDSGQGSGTGFVEDTFDLTSLVNLLTVPRSSWTLALRMADSGSQDGQDIDLDYSILSATYNPVVTGGGDDDPLTVPGEAVPEPASMILLGTGLSLLAVRQYRTRRA